MAKKKDWEASSKYWRSAFEALVDRLAGTGVTPENIDRKPTPDKPPVEYGRVVGYVDPSDSAGVTAMLREAARDAAEVLGELGIDYDPRDLRLVVGQTGPVLFDQLARAPVGWYYTTR